MRRRIIIEVLIGLALAAGLVWWLYLKPENPRTILGMNAPRIKESIASSREKVLLIAMDGMSWPIVIDMINQGRMPNMEQLLARSAHGRLMAEDPLISPAIWTTMATGVTRKVHHLDNYSAKLPFQYREVRMTSRFRDAPALWNMADRAGKKVGVVGWLTATPAEKLEHGIFIAEGLNPENAKEAAQPPEWADKALNSPLPRYLPYEELLSRVNDPRLNQVYDQDRHVFAAAYKILDEEKPDLMMVFFQNLEMVTQLYYKYRYPASLDHYEPVSEEDRDRYHDVIETHYAFCDRMIGELINRADENYTVMVLSDHSMAAAFPPSTVMPDLNRLLERLGYLYYAGPTCDQILRGFVDKGELEVPDPVSANIFGLCQELEAETRNWLERGEDMMSPPAVDAFISVRYKFKEPSDDKETQHRFDIMLDLAGRLVPHRTREIVAYEATRAYNMRDFQKDVQGIYINLKDRDPKGVVPEDEFESFRKTLIKELKSLRTEMGRYLFTEVKPNENKGIRPMGKADEPDVLVRVNRKALVDDYVYHSYDDIDPIPISTFRWIYSDVSALPEKGGVFVVAGRRAPSFLDLDVSSLDITPTVLWLLGLPVGNDMPGRVVNEIFVPFVGNREVFYVESWGE